MQLAAKFIIRPDAYMLYYDRLPPQSPQWACACAIARCVRRRPSTHVGSQRIRMRHWPEIMRYDLLLQHGGIFLDHDSYALTPLDDIRECCAGDADGAGADAAGARASCSPPAAVIAGFEQEEGCVVEVVAACAVLPPKALVFFLFQRGTFH